jgi:2-polyprenyl-3-methyl-5-hydroxy-6-metoxy-1,4-benzoquinol methylase
MNYRQRIYESYASKFQDASAVFDKPAAARWGKAYDHYFRGWLPHNRQSRLLEVACGSGRMLYFLKSHGFSNIAGVDLSPEQVRIARQVCDDVRQGDAIAYLKEYPSTFDVIIGLDIVEHFRKEEVLDFLDACYAALKPGGRLILQTPNADSPWGAAHRYNDLTHELGFNPNALSRIVALVGFRGATSREMGPAPLGYSLTSSARWMVWQCIRLLLKIWNLAETGGTGSGVYSRVFLLSAIKPNNA